MAGRYCSLELLGSTHVESLFEANQLEPHGENWIYLPYGPFQTVSEYAAWVASVGEKDDPQFFAILNEGNNAVGVASYLRIQHQVGSIEVGHIHFSPKLQRTRAATECMFLMMRRVFDELGYRRYEWKCDALNEASRRAATRLGFTYEGTFRQATVYKQRNRDTAWYSIIDAEWPSIRDAFEAWLAPDNFNGDGQQLRPLVTQSGTE